MAVETKVVPDVVKIPRVKCGDMVKWLPHPGASDHPEVGFVTRVTGENVLEISILVPGSYSLLPKTAVRHARDPLNQRRAILSSDSGVWLAMEEA